MAEEFVNWNRLYASWLTIVLCGKFLTLAAPLPDGNQTLIPELTLSRQKANPWTSRLSREEFLKISRQSFRALDGELYRGPPLDKYEKKEWKNYLDSENRPFSKYEKAAENGSKRASAGKRRRYPNRRQAFEIASRELLREPESCKTAMMKQRVRAEGCLPKVVINRYCFGQCRSVFIPKVRQKKLRAAFQSCAACLPIDYAPVLVTLRCPARPEKLIRRTVMKVKRCDCKAIELP